MNFSNVLFLVSDDVRAIRVSYEDAGKNQTIKKTLDHTITVGDFVVVETNTRWNMTVCKVTAVDVEVDFDSDDQIGWIVAKVDIAAFDAIKEQERRAVELIREAERREKKEGLRVTLEKYTGAELKALPIYTRK